METTIYWVYIGCLRFRVSGLGFTWPLQCSSFFGFDVVFWLGLLLGLPNGYYIAGSL